MANRDTSVLLASGGLDSTTVAYWLQSKDIPFVPLFINYGQHCAETEYSTLCSVLPESYRGQVETVCIADVYKGAKSRLIREADLWRDDMKGDPLYLPYRNLLLLTAGAAYAKSRDYSALYSGFINSNHAKEIDCSAKFFNELGGLLSEYGSVTVHMPFRDMPKSEVAKIALELGVPIGITYSCQASSTVPCGACPNCIDRLRALQDLIDHKS